MSDISVGRSAAGVTPDRTDMTDARGPDRPRRRLTTETKSAFKTTEFWVYIAAVERRATDGPQGGSEKGESRPYPGQGREPLDPPWRMQSRWSPRHIEASATLCPKPSRTSSTHSSLMLSLVDPLDQMAAVLHDA